MSVSTVIEIERPKPKVKKPEKQECSKCGVKIDVRALKRHEKACDGNAEHTKARMKRGRANYRKYQAQKNGQSLPPTATTNGSIESVDLDDNLIQMYQIMSDRYGQTLSENMTDFVSWMKITEQLWEKASS
jgi:hypothetical protein